MIEAMRVFAKGRGTLPAIVRDYVLPIAEAQLAHAAGRHAEAVALMRPAIGGMYRLGGSHAQQDVLEQLFVDAALKAASTDDVRLALERVEGRRPIPPERYVGWREAANRAAGATLFEEVPMKGVAEAAARARRRRAQSIGRLQPHPRERPVASGD